MSISLGCAREARLDRSAWQPVFYAAMRAFHEHDIDQLWPLLDEKGREMVERDLRSWQSRLLDPKEGPGIRDRIRRRRPDVTDETVELAARGTLRDVFSLLFEVDPRPERPPTHGVQLAPDGKSVTVLFECPSGAETKIVPALLVQTGAGWFLDRIQL